MRTLITGGAGFIGTNFVHSTVESIPDTGVVIFSKLTYVGNPKPIEGLDRVELTVGNTADPDIMDPLVKDADVVVNFAAGSHNDSSLNDPSPFIRIDIKDTFRPLETVRRRGTCFHHISTDEVYNNLEIGESRRFTSGGPYTPSDPYSSSKGTSDLLARAWIRSFGVLATISNCSGSYGPYQRAEKFIPCTITNTIGGTRPHVYGTGEQVYDWIHVCDHNTVVREIIGKGRIDETHLIGADDEENNLEVAQMILMEFGCESDDFDHVSNHPGHDQRYTIDNSELVGETSWSLNFTDFVAGLYDAVEQYKANEDWWCPQKDGVEIKCAKTGW